MVYLLLRLMPFNVLLLFVLYIFQRLPPTLYPAHCFTMSCVLPLAMLHAIQCFTSFDYLPLSVSLSVIYLFLCSMSFQSSPTTKVLTNFL